jgi:very-short-patch-repair endonuclease
MGKRNATLKRHAREMRKEPTRAESRMWQWLRNRRCAAYKFRRQVPIGPYIVDFYSCELKLAIELDGRHHDTAWMNEYDGARSAQLRAAGIQILRIPNELFIRDSLLVEQQLDAAIDAARRR